MHCWRAVCHAVCFGFTSLVRAAGGWWPDAWLLLHLRSTFQILQYGTVSLVSLDSEKSQDCTAGRPLTSVPAMIGMPGSCMYT